MPLYEDTRRALTVFPVDSARWSDLELLFGDRGACGGCWCMYWRVEKASFESGKGDANRIALRELVMSGEPVGVLGYRGDVPVGWCSIAPRKAYPRLERSRALKRVDDRPVWSVGCLFVERRHRHQGVSSELVQGAVEYARVNGATIIEAYPVVPHGDGMPGAFLWTGVPSAYRALGFTEVVRRTRTRPVMRLFL
ncbi:GNAT family N-acetyltransferase [uncultured Bifidobacterium sp.]|uniref:GNAT family N-acetyltransferase n=1 Tax=uncultured Bifidobacterium sp. TaxID=165187 RepID=UPI0028DD223E|nr:GNAT family N-acetyltransferase [uncultured Bifidobacterium sp.]